jgi:hypothetical protein
MIGDRAYDSDPLDARLQQQHGIELVAPHQIEPQSAQNPRRAQTAALLPPLENRTVVCLAP